MKLSSMSILDLRVDGLPSLSEIVSREPGAYKTLVEGEAMHRINSKGCGANRGWGRDERCSGALQQGQARDGARGADAALPARERQGGH